MVVAEALGAGTVLGLPRRDKELKDELDAEAKADADADVDATFVVVGVPVLITTLDVVLEESGLGLPGGQFWGAGAANAETAKYPKNKRY